MSMFSVTEIESYKRCRRKWWLSSLNHKAYTPIWPNMRTLGLGSLIHRAGEAWVQEPEAPFDALFMREATTFYKNLSIVCEQKNYTPTAQQDQEFWEAVTLGKNMAKNYQDYYGTPLPPEYTLVRPEQQMVVPIPGTEHCGCCAKPTPQESDCVCKGCIYYTEHTGVGSDLCVALNCTCVTYHYLEGTLDAIIGDQQDRLFVYERKTFGQHPNIPHLNRVWQFVAYSWILSQAVLHWGTGNEVAGLLYDGLWKRAAPPATGKYKDSMHSLFLRHYMQHNQERLDEFERELAPTVLEMANPNTYITHSIPAVKGCIDCLDLMDVCDRMSNGEDVSMLLRLNYTRRDFSAAFQDFYKAASMELE